MSQRLSVTFKQINVQEKSEITFQILLVHCQEQCRSFASMMNTESKYVMHIAGTRRGNDGIIFSVSYSLPFCVCPEHISTVPIFFKQPSI